jgi:hypothetical protein
MGFAVEGAMEAFCVPILGGSMWGSELVVDTVFGAPVLHGFGKQFTIVGDKNLKTLSRKVFHFQLPLLEGFCGGTLFFNGRLQT